MDNINIEQPYNELPNSKRPDIEDIGYNTYSGYVYLGLENGIIIASCFDQDCIFLPSYAFDVNEEKEFNTYYEALNYTENE